MAGSLDPETTIPQFIAELESAGANAIIAAERDYTNIPDA